MINEKEYVIYALNCFNIYSKFTPNQVVPEIHFTDKKNGVIDVYVIEPIKKIKRFNFMKLRFEKYYGAPYILWKYKEYMEPIGAALSSIAHGFKPSDGYYMVGEFDSIESILNKINNGIKPLYCRVEPSF